MNGDDFGPLIQNARTSGMNAGRKGGGSAVIRFIFGGLMVACAVVPALARGPAPVQDLRSLPMRFEWRLEGPADICGRHCRTWISASGAITADTPHDFDAFIKGRDVRGATIVLDSEGGSTLGALALGRTIRALNMTTTVGRTTELPAASGRDRRAMLSLGADCESMCTFVLLAGVKRYVPPEARVFVHQIWLGDRRNDATAASYSAEDLALVQRDIGRLATYTDEMGGSVELLDMALKIPPWEPMHLLSADELHRTRLANVDAAFDSAPEEMATNSSLSGAAGGRTLSITERGWALLDRSGQRALVRRHPLTREGEEIGRFDLTLSCAEGSDAYDVTYVERRRVFDQRALAPLKEVTIVLGQKSTALKVVSSDMASRPAEFASTARGALPAALVKSFAEASPRSLIVETAGGQDIQTSIRVGNAGAAEAFPSFAASCGKKTASAN